MTNELPESGIVGEHFCPACDPNRDPIAEAEAGNVYTIRYCSAHEPPREGPDDALVGPGYPRVGTGEAEGADCAAAARALTNAAQDHAIGRAFLQLADHLDRARKQGTSVIITESSLRRILRLVAKNLGA